MTVTDVDILIPVVIEIKACRSPRPSRAGHGVLVGRLSEASIRLSQIHPIAIAHHRPHSVGLVVAGGKGCHPLQPAGGRRAHSGHEHVKPPVAIVVSEGMRHAEGPRGIEAGVGDVIESTATIVEVEIGTAEVGDHDKIEIAVGVEIDQRRGIRAAKLLGCQPRRLGAVAEPPLPIIDQKHVAVTVVGVPILLRHGVLRRAVLSDIEIEVAVAIDIACGDGGGIHQFSPQRDLAGIRLERWLARSKTRFAGVVFKPSPDGVVADPIDESIPVDIGHQTDSAHSGLGITGQNRPGLERPPRLVPEDRVAASLE